MRGRPAAVARPLADASAEWVPRHFELQLRPAARRRPRRRRASREPVLIDGRFRCAARSISIEVHADARLAARHRSQDRAQPHHAAPRRRRRRDAAAGALRAGRRADARQAGDARRGWRSSTTAGGFTEHAVSLRDEPRRAGVEVLEIIDRAVELGALPPAPREGACGWCDFRAVCGPLEEQRATREQRRRALEASSSDLQRRCEADAVSALRRRRRPRADPRRSLDETLAVEAAAGHRQDHRARRSHRQRAGAAADDGRPHRRRDLHREGRGRAEAAAARRARGAARRRRRPRDARRRSTRRSPTSSRRTSAPSTPSAPTCCASGRSKRGVDPRFTMLTEPQARALFGEVFRDWLQERLEAPPPGVRRALRRSQLTTMAGRWGGWSGRRGRWPSGATSSGTLARDGFDRAGAHRRARRRAGDVSRARPSEPGRRAGPLFSSIGPARRAATRS